MSKFDFEEIKSAVAEAFGVKPNDYDGQNALRTWFHREDLYRLAKGCFKVECSDDWDKDYILDNLLRAGYIVVTDTSIGVIPIHGRPFGNNVWNRPNRVTIANHIIGNMDRIIGTECEVVYLNGPGRLYGIEELVNLYAMRLALCDSAIEVNIANSKTTLVFGAANKKQAATLKKMYDNISRGEPAVFVQEADLAGAQTEFFSAKAKENYIADSVQMQKRAIKEEFLTMFGVNNSNTDKRERLINAEVQSNNEELLAQTATWARNLEKGCERVNQMYGEGTLSITMPFRDMVVDSQSTLRISNGGNENESK